MEISSQLKSFLNDPQTQHLIDSNNWEKVYIKLHGYGAILNRERVTGEFTQLLFSCGINPLNHLNYVPENFLFDATVHDLSIPSHIIKINKDAFAFCDQLISIELPQKLEIINDYVFYGCISLPKIEVPDNVRIIGKYAFNYCKSLKNLTLGDNLFSIDEQVINNTSLESIKYKGTMEQWNKIYISDFNSRLNKILIHCIDGDLKYYNGGWVEV